MGNAFCNGGQTLDHEFHVPQTGFRMQVRTTKRMGWKPDMPDHRDLVLDIPTTKKKKLPKCVDLRPLELFGLYDQGHLGSCTANAIGAAFHYDQVKQGLKTFTPSRLFVYYNERKMEGTVTEDSGAYIRDGIRSLHRIGCCAESHWPYDESKFTQEPPEMCYVEAAKNRALAYARVPQTIEDIKAVLNEGYPFAFGFIVLSSFMEMDSTGVMSMPTETDGVLGGHAVCAVGYDDDKQCVIVRNSWGEEWGDKGYFYMPYAFITHPQLAQDMWYIQSIEGRQLPTKALFTHKKA